MKKLKQGYKKVLLDDISPFSQGFKPLTVFIDNNPDNNFQSGILDVTVKRLLPNKPKHKKIKSKHIKNKAK